MTEKQRRAKVVNVARGELGVRERPDGSNTGPEIVGYQRATFLGGTGWPWCVAFWQWVCQEAGAPFPYRGAGAYNLLDWARAHGRATSSPEAGDAVIFNTGAGHLGVFVKFDDDGNVITIDGNVSNMVAQKTRPRSLVRGYVSVELPKADKPPVKPAGPKVFEVVTSESGTEKVVAVGDRFRVAKLLAGKSAYWLKRYGRFRVRPRA